MDTHKGGMSLRCDDCGGEASVASRHDDPQYPERVKQFLTDHGCCARSVSLTISMPELREQLLPVGPAV